MKVSVALCTYNGELFLREQLESINKQTLLPQQIVIVDDGSTDKTIDILTEFKRHSDLNIHIFKNQKNLGYIKNFEKAIKLCDNDIVLLCDQDDIWQPNKVERITHFFKENPNIDLLCHNLNLINEQGVEKNLTLWEVTAFSRFLDKYLNKENTILNRVLIFGNTVSGASMAFRKSKLKIGFDTDFPIAMAHDYQILLYFLLKGEVKFIHENLTGYRLHNNQNIGMPLNSIAQTRQATDVFYQKKLIKKRLFRVWYAHNKLKKELPNELKEDALKHLHKWKLQAQEEYFGKTLLSKLKGKLSWKMMIVKFKIKNFVKDTTA